jgi:hypothetical protein
MAIDFRRNLPAPSRVHESICIKRLDQFAHGSSALLRYVGLAGEGKLAQAIRAICLPISNFKTH